MTYVPTQGKCPVCHHDNTMTPAEQVGMAAMSGFEQLQQQLAAEQAYSAKLRELVLEALNGFASTQDAADWDAKAELALSYDDSALREWGARLLRSAAAKQGWKSDEVALKALADQLLSGDWKPELEAK